MLHFNYFHFNRLLLDTRVTTCQCCVTQIQLTFNYIRFFKSTLIFRHLLLHKPIQHLLFSLSLFSYHITHLSYLSHHSLYFYLSHGIKLVYECTHIIFLFILSLMPTCQCCIWCPTQTHVTFDHFYRSNYNRCRHVSISVLSSMSMSLIKLNNNNIETHKTIIN
jgi:hypothetical protein